MSTVHFVNAPAGAGKTHVMCRRAHDLASAGEAVLIVLPTLSLIAEVESGLRALSPAASVEAIHGNIAGSVVRSIGIALQAGPQQGRILIITWSAFVRLPFFPNRAAWHVFIDEIPQAYSSLTAIVPQTHTFLTDHVELRPMGPRYGRIVVKNSSALKRLADTDDDALNKTLGCMARDFLSPNLNGYAALTSYEALLTGNGKKLTLFFLLRPRILYGFKRVTILGASFFASLLYMLWSSDGVLFIEDGSLAAQLRYQEHSNGHLVQIRYGVQGQWSKNLRDKEDQRLLRDMILSAANWMTGEPFAFIANKDVMDVGLFQGHQAHPLPQVSHGLNGFSHLDNLVYLSARLPPPDQYDFLAWRGADPQAVRRAVHEEAIYQTVMRCSIRHPESRSLKKVVVPDWSSAKHLQAVLPGSTVEKLDGIDESAARYPRGRKRQFDDSSSRSRAHRIRRNTEISRLAAMMIGESGEFTTVGEGVAVPAMYSSDQKTCNENAIRDNSRNNVAQKARGSIFANLRATHPTAIMPEMSDDLMISALKKAHNEKSPQKEDNHLISPAVFDSNLSETTSRGLANVLYANGIFLDVDVGDMTHKDLAAIFPHLRIVVFNSFSSTKAAPRYRAYIPTSRSASVREYSSIVNQMIQVVQDSGFPVAKRDPAWPGLKAHGIDLTKRHAASLFYLPCQPKDPTGKIWKDHHGGTRKPLDVDNWLEHAIPIETQDYVAETVQAQPEKQTPDQPIFDQAIVDHAMEQWNREGVLPGRGDAELWVLSQKLKRAGVPFFDAEVMLLRAARTAHTPQDRLRQARAIMRAARCSWPS